MYIPVTLHIFIANTHSVLLPTEVKYREIFSEHLCSENPPEHLQHHPQDPPPDVVEAPRLTQSCRVEYERCPVPNSPWKESSLDQPYRKPTKTQSANSSRSW